MKPENKLPILDLISAEMKTVVNTIQPIYRPGLPRERTLSKRQYYRLSADSECGRPEWQIQSLQGSK